MTQFDLRDKNTRQDFDNLIAGLKQEARERGWESTLDEILEDTGTKQFVRSTGKIEARLKFRVRTEHMGDVGKALNEEFGGSTYHNIEQTIELPLNSGEGCICPVTDAAAERRVKEWADQKVTPYAGSGAVAWVDVVAGSLAYSCDSSDCRRH